MVQFVVVIRAAVRAMVQLILVMIGALALAFAVKVDDPDDPDMLLFRVSTENLNSLIARLRSLGGLSRYPAAYQALVLELSRRELRSAPQEILLARQVFQALPRDVQQQLTAEQP
jgi:hypothetical protein